MKDKHCSGAILDNNGKCIAICHHNLSTGYQTDCMGIDHAEPNADGREVQITACRALATEEPKEKETVGSFRPWVASFDQ